MCFICKRIEMIKNGTNPFFVKELETGYVVIGDNQHFTGYTLFLCKEHKTELFHLDRDFKMKYLEEMTIVAQAVSNAFKSDMSCWETEKHTSTGTCFPVKRGILKTTVTPAKDLSGGIQWKKCMTRQMFPRKKKEKI